MACWPMEKSGLQGNALQRGIANELDFILRAAQYNCLLNTVPVLKQKTKRNDCGTLEICYEHENHKAALSVRTHTARLLRKLYFVRATVPTILF